MIVSAPSRTWQTPADVAELLALDVPAVLRLIRAGELIAHDLSSPGSKSKRYRINPADLEAFLLRRRSQAPTAQPKKRKASPAIGGVKFY